MPAMAIQISGFAVIHEHSDQTAGESADEKAPMARDPALGQKRGAGADDDGADVAALAPHPRRHGREEGGEDEVEAEGFGRADAVADDVSRGRSAHPGQILRNAGAEEKPAIGWLALPAAQR